MFHTSHHVLRDILRYVSTPFHSFPNFSSVQSLSHVTLWTAACWDSPPITNSRRWLELMSIESVMPSNQLILCRPLLLLPSILPSIRVFSNKSILNQSIDWFVLLEVQGPLKSPLKTTVQNHQLFGTWLSLWSNSHIHTWILEKL